MKLYRYVKIDWDKKSNRPDIDYVQGLQNVRAVCPVKLSWSRIGKGWCGYDGPREYWAFEVKEA